MTVKQSESPIRRAELATAWFLVARLGSDRLPQHYAVRKFPFLIGRRTDASLCLPFPTISSLHAEIDQHGDALLLRDLNSTNGTFRNGRRVENTVTLQEGDLIQLADIALRIQRHDARRETRTLSEDVCDQALALVQFDKLMTERQVTPNYQPIICLDNQHTVAFEVVGRSKLFGVETPKAMFGAAAKLNLEVPLSNMLRWEGVVRSIQTDAMPHLFVNTHPRELEEAGLIQSLRDLRMASPAQALTLEIHENAVSDVNELANLKNALVDLDISLAYDDFGVGQSRFNELTEVAPHYIKFDISLIRNLNEASAQRQQMVQRLVDMAKDVGSITLAEGVETEAEADTCREIGFELAQGFLFGRPFPFHHYFDAEIGQAG